ncbi:MAG TPA: hypothetical protein PK243_10590 [Flexilinea sp.]|nr:hypothetical protein [Flexilinea sp.]
MKTIKKVKYIVIDGEVKKTEDILEKKEKLGKAEPVVKNVLDSTATNLVNKTKVELARAKAKKVTIDIDGWEEVENKADNSNTAEAKAGKGKKPADNKTQGSGDGDEFDPKTANKEPLIAYAKENNIDLGEASKVDEIRPIVVKWHEENAQKGGE